MTYEQMGAKWGCAPRAIVRAEDDAAQSTDGLSVVAKRHGVQVGAVSAALRGRMRGAKEECGRSVVILAGVVVVP